MTARAWLPTIALVCFVPACMLPLKIKVTRDGGPQYTRLTIVYEAHGSQGAVFLPTAYSPDLSEPLEFDEEAGERWAIPRLTIEYPHPNGSTDMALATLRHVPATREASQHNRRSVRVRTAPIRKSLHASLPRVRRDKAEERIVGVMDVPKHQLDLLLLDLANNGFFDPQIRPISPAMLSVRIDRGRTAKPWSFDARLDDLVIRTQSSGFEADGATDSEPAPRIVHSLSEADSR